ncbi:DUF4129 domain-containing protein [Sporolactobacillus terrae]|uniref:DUF4129 domain-containing protein n=1 Tax=Sporolactobacillus terrae TaxID=269673 RepID=UPI001119601D|nr:DUF4129 domain-containing protein [Sporolactobacillus terrae]
MVAFKHLLTFILYLACEWLFCFLVLLPFIAHQWAPLILFACLAVIHMLLLGSLQKLRHVTFAAFLSVSVLIGLAALILFHLSLFASMLLTALLTYFSIRGDEGRSVERLWRLIVLFAAVVCIYALFTPIRHPSALFILLIAELAAALTLIHLTSGIRGHVLLLISGILAVTACITSMIAALLKPAVTFIYDSLFNFIVKPLSYGAFSVLFGWLNGRLTPHANSEIKRALQRSSTEKKTSMQKIVPDAQANFNFGLLFGILIVVLLLLIAFWQLRRINMSKAKKNVQDDAIKTEKIPLQSAPKRDRKPIRLSAPKHTVRRAIYRLQKQAKKVGCGRHPYESLQEWLFRLNLNATDRLITYYEKVRYGNQELTASEQAMYLDSVHDAEKQLKRLK